MGEKIHLDFPSVGATENAMLVAVLAKGTTVISNAAMEPEIIDLQNFLNKMGAKITGAGTNEIIIHGVTKLKDTSYTVMPDRIEAGTLLCATAITGGNIVLKKVTPEHLTPVLEKLKECGCDIEEGKDTIVMRAPKKLKAVEIKTMPYPGFPTDMQSIFACMLTIAKGTSIITENIFETLKVGIKDDYGKLVTGSLSEDIDYLELVSWCVRKDFIQQALTLVEDKMPKLYFDKGILSCEFEEEQEEVFCKKVGQSYEKRLENLVFYNLQSKRIAYKVLWEVLWELENIISKDENKKTDKYNEFKSKSKENKIQYIEEILKNNGIVNEKIKQDNLKNYAEELETDANRKVNPEEFSEKYCEFRIRNKIWEDENGIRNLLNLEMFYDLVKDKIKEFDTSILCCIGECLYHYTNEDKNITLLINKKSNIEEVTMRQELNSLFLLHNALKKERNCSNHASEKGVRLSINVVKYALEVYVQKLRYIIENLEIND